MLQKLGTHGIQETIYKIYKQLGIRGDSLGTPSARGTQSGAVLWGLHNSGSHHANTPHWNTSAGVRDLPGFYCSNPRTEKGTWYMGRLTGDC